MTIEATISELTITGPEAGIDSIDIGPVKIESFSVTPTPSDVNILALVAGSSLTINKLYPYSVVKIFSDGTSTKSAVFEGDTGVTEEVEASNWIISNDGKYLFSNDNKLAQGA